MSEDILDVDDFMDRVQNDTDLFFELLDIFANDFHIKRRELEEAIAAKDHESVEHVAHFLKGSCGNISAKPLREIFHDLEVRGKQKNLDGLENYLNVIDGKFRELTARIGELKSKLR